MFQEPSVECSNGSEASGEHSCLLNKLKNHENLILIFSDEKFFTVDPVFDKQDDHVVTFGNDVSEHW